MWRSIAWVICFAAGSLSASPWDIGMPDDLALRILECTDPSTMAKAAVVCKSLNQRLGELGLEESYYAKRIDSDLYPADDSPRHLVLMRERWARLLPRMRLNESQLVQDTPQKLDVEREQSLIGAFSHKLRDFRASLGLNPLVGVIADTGKLSLVNNTMISEMSWVDLQDWRKHEAALFDSVGVTHRNAPCAMFMRKSAAPPVFECMPVPGAEQISGVIELEMGNIVDAILQGNMLLILRYWKSPQNRRIVSLEGYRLPGTTRFHLQRPYFRWSREFGNWEIGSERHQPKITSNQKFAILDPAGSETELYAFRMERGSLVSHLQLPNRRRDVLDMQIVMSNYCLLVAVRSWQYPHTTVLHSFSLEVMRGQMRPEYHIQRVIAGAGSETGLPALEYKMQVSLDDQHLFLSAREQKSGVNHEQFLAIVDVFTGECRTYRSTNIQSVKPRTWLVQKPREPRNRDLAVTLLKNFISIRKSGIAPR